MRSYGRALTQVLITNWQHLPTAFASDSTTTTKGVCLLHLQRLNPELLQLLTFSTP